MDNTLIERIVRRMIGRCGRLAEEAERLEVDVDVEEWLAELELLEATAEAIACLDPARGAELHACTADLRAFRRDDLGIGPGVIVVAR